MRPQRLIIWLLILLPVYLSGQEKKNLAVLDLDGFGISEQEAQVLTNRLRTYLVQTNKYQVIERQEMQQILTEQDFQIVGCTSDECAVEIGRLLGVQVMVAGSVGKIGSTYSLDMRLIDVESGGILGTALYDIRGEIDLVLTEGMAEVVKRIARIESQIPATIQISSQPSRATVLIDSIEYGVTPLQAIEVAPDTLHSISLQLLEYRSVDTTIFTVAGGSYQLSIPLAPVGNPLTIHTSPQGAAILINGEEIGTTPLIDFELAPDQQYVVTAALPGYYIVDTTLFAEKGKVFDLSIPLEPMGNQLSIHSFPPGAAIVINGIEIGTTPLVNFDLEPNQQYLVSLSLPGYLSTDTTLVAEAGQGYQLSIPLVPLASRVTIRSSPTMGATVEINGEAIGKTPISRFELRPNEQYSLTIRLPGYEQVDTTLFIDAGQSYLLNIALEQTKNWLTIEGNAGSRISLDGKKVGKLPLEGMLLPSGSYDLLATKPEYYPYNEKVTIDNNQGRTISFSLKKKPKVAAVMFSTILPGTGQLYQGYSGRGWLFLAGAAGIGLTVYANHYLYQQDNDLYLERLEDYRQAIDINEIILMREAVQESFDSMKKYEDDRNTYMGVLGAFWVLNLIEVIF